MVHNRNFVNVWSLQFQNYCFLSLFLDDVKNNKRRITHYLFIYEIKTSVHMLFTKIGKNIFLVYEF